MARQIKSRQRWNSTLVGITFDNPKPGKVVFYNTESKLFTVVIQGQNKVELYLKRDEVLQLINISRSPPEGTDRNTTHHFIGTRIEHTFGTSKVAGYVQNYMPQLRQFEIKYANGVLECMTECAIRERLGQVVDLTLDDSDCDSVDVEVNSQHTSHALIQPSSSKNRIVEDTESDEEVVKPNAQTGEHVPALQPSQTDTPIPARGLTSSTNLVHPRDPTKPTKPTPVPVYASPIPISHNGKNKRQRGPSAPSLQHDNTKTGEIGMRVKCNDFSCDDASDGSRRRRSYQQVEAPLPKTTPKGPLLTHANDPEEAFSCCKDCMASFSEPQKSNTFVISKQPVEKVSPIAATIPSKIQVNTEDTESSSSIQRTYAQREHIRKRKEFLEQREKKNLAMKRIVMNHDEKKKYPKINTTDRIQDLKAEEFLARRQRHIAAIERKERQRPIAPRISQTQIYSRHNPLKSPNETQNEIASNAPRYLSRDIQENSNENRNDFVWC